MTARRLLATLTLAALSLDVVACGPPTSSPTPSAGPVVVTFEVSGDERFKVLLTDPADIDIARRLLAGEDAPGIPSGRILHDPGVNTGYSWSLDPGDITFTDETDEDCDGSPSDVESGQLSGDRYCPSDAVVVAVDPAP
jgi:hypothetical protein